MKILESYGEENAPQSTTDMQNAINIKSIKTKLIMSGRQRLEDINHANVRQ